jgi:hypothetical protein
MIMIMVVHVSRLGKDQILKQSRECQASKPPSRQAASLLYSGTSLDLKKTDGQVSSSLTHSLMLHLLYQVRIRPAYELSFE